MFTLPFTPIFAASAFVYAIEKATTEGKITICALVVVSLFSWTVIITKFRQLYRARKMARKFFAAYRSTRDPMEIFRKKLEFDGAPAYELYFVGAEETEYHLKNNPVELTQVQSVNNGEGKKSSGFAETDHLAKSILTKISHASFESVKVALERAASAEALSLEKGMIVLSTAVAGVDPAVMGYGPVPATRKALARAGIEVGDLDLVELNEAFASQSIVCIDDLGLDPAKVNVNGGAIALGHPLGMSGSRLITMLTHELRRTGGRFGLATMCIGVGQGIATIVERIES